MSIRLGAIPFNIFFVIRENNYTGATRRFVTSALHAATISP
jgi:hypothetical protein